MAPGTTGLSGGRPSPAPIVKARHVPAKPRSSSSPQAEVEVQTVVDNRQESVAVRTAGGFQSSASESVQPVTAAPETAVATVRVPLSTLCWARSGDKGDMSNIGVIARRAEWLPFLRTWLTEERVLDWFSHAVHGSVTRYDVPGINAMNFVMTGALAGGGTVSLRTDALGKAFGQILLAMPVDAPASLLDSSKCEMKTVVPLKA
eukprot:CAMPEP_0181216912 /NCGR_PEP_ID=MMETSP1096-20121128/26853_1 /TAXON_ID=156174 ORGANISM="Chrysochromulina ericina, Strain CCMP281" /NCGR_SAMPLE_ID=MMETSP1096 /ASSEMBLY_ACC=CAM_ASM_000453 /LENGTH=203 /DNA_ID=CAMNT_0023308973 /DNA_START=23 /DNA_END=638 /DNA_ORIENTATION=+